MKALELGNVASLLTLTREAPLMPDGLRFSPIFEGAVGVVRELTDGCIQATGVAGLSGNPPRKIRAEPLPRGGSGIRQVLGHRSWIW